MKRTMSSLKEKKSKLICDRINDESSNKSPKNFILKPVLSDEYFESTPVTDAFIGIVKQKNTISIAIKSITSILPGFGHLKRCFRGQLLLALLHTDEKINKDTETNSNPSFLSQEDLKKFLLSHNFDLSLLKADFLILPVPLLLPKTKDQAKNAAVFWPITFHPDVQIEQMLSGNFFNSTQLDAIQACTRVCNEAVCCESVDNKDCNGSAVIFNPNDNGIGRIIAVAITRVNEHPLWHSAMLAVDLVAKMRGGGAWQLHANHFLTSENIENDSDSRKRKLEEVKIPFCYPESLSSINFPIFLHPVNQSESSTRSKDDVHDDCPYLCTNYWVFLHQEPCSMCAMALLHSRVAMIFYGSSNKSHGVLGSKSLLHSLAGLNHRYKVWYTGGGDALEDDCKTTALEINQRVEQ